MDTAIQNVVDAQQGALAVRIQTAVARKRLDAARSAGEAINRVLEEAVHLSKAPDRGEQFDRVG